ncbi:MAG: hypothetical protein ACLGGX_12120, partial [Bdellovibrionia bacterium]
MNKFLLVLFVTIAFPFSTFADEKVTIDLPNATGDVAAPINDSRASINAFSCAEIASGWKDNEVVSKHLKIGYDRGLKFLAWMESAHRDKMIKVGMNIAGFWNINSLGKNISPDFYLGQVSASVSSFIFDKHFKEKLPEYPPKNTFEYLKSEKKRILEKR